MINEAVQQVKAWAQCQPEILALYLFGSTMHGRNTALSDVDIGVWVRPNITSDEAWTLEINWAAQLPDIIDLRIVNYAPLPFRYEVTACGRRLWAADDAAAAAAESVVWREYWNEHTRLEQAWDQFVEHTLEGRNAAERDQYEAALAKVRDVHRRVKEAAERAGSPAS